MNNTTQFFGYSSHTPSTKKRPFVLVRSNKYSGNPFGRNDPYDENGNGYGGGNNDSLKQMLDAGVDVSMVQIGNEINYGMCGETIAGNVTKLLKSGSSAVREISDTYNQDIQIVVHYTNITQSAALYSLIKNLQTSELDYDIIGLSYYPFWNGDMDNMKKVVETIQKDYGKKVMIAETSYCYTSEDGDGNANSLAGTDDLVDGYPATVQGQTDMIRDVIAAANDAGLYYGGSAWDNQAFFDFEGHPLESLKLFNYLKEGTK